MTPGAQRQPQDSRLKFLKVVGVLWGAAILIILLATLLAPCFGRMVDFILHQTTYRDWSRLTLHVQQPFFDLSAPLYTVKSYYSALYRGDAAAMERLTTDTFQEQMRLRVAHTQPVTDTALYRSYLRTEQAEPPDVAVVEKFHLFWKRGLRFRLRRNATDWRIAQVELLQ